MSKWNIFWNTIYNGSIELGVFRKWDTYSTGYIIQAVLARAGTKRKNFTKEGICASGAQKQSRPDELRGSAGRIVQRIGNPMNDLANVRM